VSHVYRALSLFEKKHNSTSTSITAQESATHFFSGDLRKGQK